MAFSHDVVEDLKDMDPPFRETGFAPGNFELEQEEGTSWNPLTLPCAGEERREGLEISPRNAGGRSSTSSTLKPTIRSVAAAQDGVQRVVDVVPLHVEKCSWSVRRTFFFFFIRKAMLGRCTGFQHVRAQSANQAETHDEKT